MTHHLHLGADEETLGLQTLHAADRLALQEESEKGPFNRALVGWEMPGVSRLGFVSTIIRRAVIIR